MTTVAAPSRKGSLGRDDTALLSLARLVFCDGSHAVSKIDSPGCGCNDPTKIGKESAMAGVDWTDAKIEAAGIKLHLARAGKGRPVVVLHHETGTLDNLPFYDALAAKYDVLVPHHPGYSRSERPDWMRSTRDIAIVYRGLLSELELQDAALVGLGFGGWIAAEMALMAPADPARLVLVGAMGIKPPQGDILDLAITGYIDYARAGFHDQQAFDRVYGAEPSDDQLEMWDICREMSFRIAWKPYMYSQTMPYLLGAVQTPTLVVWGDDDKVVPISAGKKYVEALPNARMEIVKACGHCIDMEQPDTLARLVTNFISQG
jgi:pimeloyl-ACP methyl ester carboxylesterase